MEHPNSKNKLLTELEVEELLNQVNQDTTTQELEVFEYKNDIIPFISIFNIQNGDHRVSGKLLYDLYKEWSKEPLPYKVFFQEIVKLLIPLNIKRQYYFNVNINNDFIISEVFKRHSKNHRSKLKNKHYKQQFEKFLKERNIKSGIYYIEGFILYELYSDWLYDTRKKPISYLVFLKFCNLYFKNKKLRKDNLKYYAVDPSIKELIGIDRLQLIRERYRNDNFKKKK